MPNKREEKREENRAAVKSQRREWSRLPAQPFNDVAREEFAKARAKGASPKVACQLAGVSVTNTRWASDPAMLERVRELREGAENFVGVSKAWIIGQLKKNVEESREQGAYKASNEALTLLYKIVNEDKDIAEQMARALPPDVRTSEIKKRLRDAFAQPKPGRALLKPPEPAPAIDAPTEPEDDEAAQ